ncbi:MAG: hypothetical protein ACYDD5_00545 [Sulfuricurvum sp.]
MQTVTTLPKEIKEGHTRISIGRASTSHKVPSSSPAELGYNPQQCAAIERIKLEMKRS